MTVDDRFEPDAGAVPQQHASRVYPASERVLPRKAPPLDRADLIEQHLKLARHLALRYCDRGEPLDDLVQVASLGLVKAADRFDPSRGVSFTSFAVPTILGELRRHFRDHAWAVRVPRDLQEAALRVRRVLSQLAGSEAESPTPATLAHLTGLTVEQVLEALDAAGAQRALSLEAPIGFGDDGEQGTLHEVLGEEDHELDRVGDRTTLAQLGRVLSAREREILRLRFELDLTQSEIGARIGLSQMQISRIIRAALARMRDAATLESSTAEGTGRADGQQGDEE